MAPICNNSFCIDVKTYVNKTFQKKTIDQAKLDRVENYSETTQIIKKVGNEEQARKKSFFQIA